MNTDHLSPYILTLVTFVPLAGALLLVLLLLFPEGALALRQSRNPRFAAR